MAERDLVFDPDVDFSEHLEGLRDALAEFVDQAHHAGLDAPVPTCPAWTVRKLIAHWLQEGALRLLEALGAASPDLKAVVFLNDAPTPRRFWARRQCHETSIHAVDALSAALGRPPRADETWISREIALDGIDELLTGFITRPRAKFRTQEPVEILVKPHDSDHRWTVHATPESVTTERTGRHADVWSHWRASSRVTWS